MCSYSTLDRLTQRKFIVRVHGFADASNPAYAAIVYLRIIHSPTDFQVSLICVKTKVASVKTISILRLELNAIMLLSRLLLWTRQSPCRTFEFMDEPIPR